MLLKKLLVSGGLFVGLLLALSRVFFAKAAMISRFTSIPHERSRNASMI